MASDLFKKYIWLVDTIYQYGPISFAEINRRWQDSSLANGSNIALRTFHNHREAVEELFHIRIVCDDRTNRYYIENSDDIGSDMLTNWLLNSFSISNLLQEMRGSNSLVGRVLIEEVPSAQQHLTKLLDAMRENRRVQVVYQPFYGDDPKELTLQPLFVKLYERRWYLYANKADDPKIKLYALDRIQSVAVTDEAFKMPKKFSPADYLAGTFGVSVYDSIKPCTIRVRAHGMAQHYLRSLPLHASQQEVGSDPVAGTADFEYFVAPTREFYQALLAHTDLEVVSPEAVRLELLGKLYEAQLLNC